MELEIKTRILEEHEGDNSQINAIFSEFSRIMLEAPAGCGKTKTMVSKVAYVIATNAIPANKKILALTFSVNAAYKMKKDIAEKLPNMGISTIATPANLNHKISITNYHGFARRLLSLYGYLLHIDLPNVNLFTAYNEENLHGIEVSGIELSDIDKELLGTFSKAVKECDSDKVEIIFRNTTRF